MKQRLIVAVGFVATWRARSLGRVERSPHRLWNVLSTIIEMWTHVFGWKELNLCCANWHDLCANHILVISRRGMEGWAGEWSVVSELNSFDTAHIIIFGGCVCLRGFQDICTLITCSRGMWVLNKQILATSYLISKLFTSSISRYEYEISKRDFKLKV